MKFEIIGLDTAQIAEVSGQMAQTFLNNAANDDAYFELGMQYAAGRAVPRDLVAAHKWFNIAAMRGNKDAVSYRKELSLEMTSDEVAIALSDAREFLTMH